MRRSVVAEEAFVISYDGPALDGHEMDVRELAPALLKLADAFQRAQRVLHPTQTPVTLNIKATSEGSFEVHMLLVEATKHVIDLFSSKEADAAANLAGIGGAVWGTVALIKKFGSKVVRRHEPTPGKPGEVTVTFTDGTSVSMPDDRFDLYSSFEFRQDVSEVMRPLEREGVDTFNSKIGRETRVTITKSDLPAFRAPSASSEDDLGTSMRSTVLQAIGVEFDNRKWRFSEGGASITASIEDTAFRDKVERREIIFGKGDLLRVNLRTRQYRDRDGKLRAEHAIERVTEHIDGGRQIPLDIDELDEE